jgi:hypothetical protein
MSQTLNSILAFDGSNYGYWKALMHCFLKSIDCWGIVETGWTKPEDTTPELVPQKNSRLSNDKALHALRQVLSPSEFAKISNCESAKAAWQILETTYEGTKLVKSAKLQMLISKFKVTTIEESKDLEEMKIEELVGSLQIYELSLSPVKKLKTIALKASKKKVEASSEEESEDEEKALAMLAKNFRRLMKDDRFKKKFSEKAKKPLREAEPEDEKDPRGPRCFECSGYGHIRADCGNLKKGKGKAYNVTLSDESEEDAPESDKFLAFVAPYVDEEDSYYSEHSEN